MKSKCFYTMAAVMGLSVKRPDYERALLGCSRSLVGIRTRLPLLGFTPATELDLIKPSAHGISITRIRLRVADSIAFARMNSRFHYDRNMNLAVGDYALLRLHKGYSIPSAPNRKLDQRYVGPSMHNHRTQERRVGGKH